MALLPERPRRRAPRHRDRSGPRAIRPYRPARRRAAAAVLLAFALGGTGVAGAAAAPKHLSLAPKHLSLAPAHLPVVVQAAPKHL